MNSDIEVSHEDCNHETLAEKSSKLHPISAPAIKSMFALRNFAVIHVLQFFADDYLPEELLQITVPIRVVAFDMVDRTLDGPELTVALRKLLDAREGFIRHYHASKNWSAYNNGNPLHQ